MILAASLAFASPPLDPAELEDAAQNARAVQARCRLRPACTEGDRGLAWAFLVTAVASAVLEGQPDPDSAASARALAPDILDPWEDLLVPGGTVAPWVQERLAPPQPLTPAERHAGRWRVSLGSFWGGRLLRGGRVLVSQQYGGYLEVPLGWFGVVLDVTGGRVLRTVWLSPRYRLWANIGEAYLGVGTSRRWSRIELNASVGPAGHMVAHSAKRRAQVDYLFGEPSQARDLRGIGAGARVRVGLRTARSVWVELAMEGRAYETGHAWFRPSAAVSARAGAYASFAIELWGRAQEDALLWGVSPMVRIGPSSPRSP